MIFIAKIITHCNLNSKVKFFLSLSDGSSLPMGKFHEMYIRKFDFLHIYIKVE